MKKKLGLLALLLTVTLLCACARRSQKYGGGGYNPSYGPPPGGGPCWPIAPLQLQVLEHGREFEPISMVAADGQLLHVKGGSMGMIRGDVLHGSQGQLRCQNRQVSMGPGPGAFYSDRGELVFPHEAVIFVADDGTVFMTMGNRRVFGPKGSGADGVARVAGPVSTARHTAALLVFLSLGGPPSR